MLSVDRAEHAKLVARRARLRLEVQLDLNTIRYWNRLHPDQPIDDAFEVAVLAFLDGEGPMPTPPATSVPHA